MRYIITLLVLLCVFAPSGLMAGPGALSAKSILAKDPDTIASDLHDVSEAGQDRAARIWATAKRLETETKLAATSVPGVMQLDYWRQTLNRWQDLWLDLRSVESGGGTMWGHFAARNDATLEKFLAAQCEGLSMDFSDSEENVSLDVLGRAAKHVQKGKVLAKDMGRDIDQLSKKLLQQVEEMQAELHFSIAGIRDAETRKSVNQWVVDRTK